jgi:hypothetical protein
VGYDTLDEETRYMAGKRLEQGESLYDMFADPPIDHPAILWESWDRYF